MGVSGDDGCLVRKEQAEDLIADFSWEFEEGEGHWDGRSRSKRSDPRGWSK